MSVSPTNPYTSTHYTQDSDLEELSRLFPSLDPENEKIQPKEAPEKRRPHTWDHPNWLNTNEKTIESEKNPSE